MRLGAYLGVLAASLWLSGAGVHATPLPTAPEAPHLRVVLNRDSPPFVVTDAEGAPRGYAVDWARVESGMALMTAGEGQALGERWHQSPGFWMRYGRVIDAGVALVLVVLALLGLWIVLLRRAVAQRTRALVSEQQSLRSLFDALPDLVLIKNLQGVITESNKSTMFAFDQTVKQLRGSHAYELLEHGQAARLSAVEAQVLANGQAQTFMLELMRDEQRLAHEEIYIGPVRDRDGRITGTVSVVHDITSRLKLQDELRLWAHAVRKADFGVQILDIATRTIVAVNEQFARQRGYEAQQMQGMPYAALFPGDVAVVQESFLQAIGDIEHQIVETEHVRRGGERFPVLVDRSIYRDAAGQPRYVVAYAQDITERRRAQVEQRLAAVAFNTQDATMVLDGCGRVLRVNRAFSELTGYGQAHVLGREPFFLHTTASGEGVSAELRAQVCAAKGWRGQLWLQPRTGKPRVVRANVSAVVDQQMQRASHFVCALIDVTSEREALATPSA